MFRRHILNMLVVSIALLFGVWGYDLMMPQTCPFPQFEGLTDQNATLAARAESSLTLQAGSCAGASLIVRALGQRTTIMDVSRIPVNCTAKDLFQAVKGASVVVPKEYTGASDVVRTAAAMPVNVRWEHDMLRILEFSRSGCSKRMLSSAPLPTILHAPKDFGNLNMW